MAAFLHNHTFLNSSNNICILNCWQTMGNHNGRTTLTCLADERKNSISILNCRLTTRNHKWWLYDPKALTDKKNKWNEHYCLLANDAWWGSVAEWSLGQTWIRGSRVQVLLVLFHGSPGYNSLGHVCKQQAGLICLLPNGFFNHVIFNLNYLSTKLNARHPSKFC